MDQAPPEITGFHAHVYYDAGEKARAERLREAVEERFEVVMGRWHDAPIGPHPRGSYQIAFAPAVFGGLVPWLALNRDGLTILVHPETGDDIPDHTDHALWLGPPEPLDIDALG